MVLRVPVFSVLRLIGRSTLPSLLGLVNGCEWIEEDMEKAILWRYSLLLYGFIDLFSDIDALFGNEGSLCEGSSCRAVG